MTEQRDQWGETAEERHARILARDLAWQAYAEGCARDGVPRDEGDHGVFNAGYAAGRSDYLPGAGVVTEEPEWQYSYVERIGHFGDVCERVTFDSLGSAQQYLRANADSIISWNREAKKRDRKTAGVEKRRMNIGEWVPVKQEGTTE